MLMTKLTKSMVAPRMRSLKLHSATLSVTLRAPPATWHYRFLLAANAVD
jgi:hypothetical protein